jgi:phenylacetate-coenzyme A ligase PaaK-like adenylate-forming protein
MNEAVYWNAVETMSRKEIQALQLGRLTALLNHLEENSRFYRNRLASHGVSWRT